MIILGRDKLCIKIKLLHILRRVSYWLGLVIHLPIQGTDVRDASLIPGSGSFPGGGNGNQIQYSCLEDPWHREAWQVTVHVVTVLFLLIILFGTHFLCGYLLWKCLCTELEIYLSSCAPKCS